MARQSSIADPSSTLLLCAPFSLILAYHRTGVAGCLSRSLSHTLRTRLALLLVPCIRYQPTNTTTKPVMLLVLMLSCLARRPFSSSSAHTLVRFALPEPGFLLCVFLLLLLVARYLCWSPCAHTTAVSRDLCAHQHDSRTAPVLPRFLLEAVAPSPSASSVIRKASFSMWFPGPIEQVPYGHYRAGCRLRSSRPTDGVVIDRSNSPTN